MFPEYHLTDSVRAYLPPCRVMTTYNKFTLPSQITPANPDEAIVILALTERG